MKMSAQEALAHLASSGENFRTFRHDEIIPAALETLNLLLADAYHSGISFLPLAERAIIPGSTRPAPFQIRLVRLSP